MRNALLAILIGWCPALIGPAHSSSLQKLTKPEATQKLVPIKHAPDNNSCAAYGPGFAKVEGTETCVRIGGQIRLDAGASTGR